MNIENIPELTSHRIIHNITEPPEFFELFGYAKKRIQTKDSF